ncbi:SAM-dependent methyltransferase [Citricoccus sp. SGAir0253]|uniref:Eco57I restriction-modification methylase domain-containing protein n=1 Tax=Citricoccus sp. SGAir0253 TaxID=2567881 RepID=UPI0010CD2425|nr:Eco57I restriction-modification methylase domain-containing protein [Citricoccus sp. SGAir0253]QCU78671.1 SAM-dependent methyltransferase [Citricoccus sp. SGAir0253]
MQGDWTTYAEVFTRRWVVETILDLIGYNPDDDLGGKVIVEPSVGSGAFLVSIVKRLLTSAEKHGRPVESLSGALKGYDLQEESVERSREAIRPLLTNVGITGASAEALLAEWVQVADFLLTEDIPAADFVVGNPPYIRLEDIPPEVSAAYRLRWPTMQGRADIYVGFYERALSLLNEGGRLGYICADRWMRNQYGARLRALVAKDFAVESVWIMHDVDAFESQVSAYPAITVIRRGSQSEVVVADTTFSFGAGSAAELAAWTLTGDGLTLNGRGFEAYRLEGWFPGDEMWAAGSPALIALMEHLNEHFYPLQDASTGTKVSIGVASGADKVYVVKSADVEEDRLLPLAMVGDLRQTGDFEWGGNYLVNPWTEEGQLVDLERYPRLRAYYEAAPKLHERHVAKKNRSNWYRTIDKVHHSLTAKPKLLIQDMRASINPVLEPGGHYPHHNLYYITSESWDMEVLGGILLSRVGQAFIQAYAVRMRGGTLRFQAQYLKKIRVPRPSDLDADVSDRLRAAFRSRDEEAATDAAAEAYGIDLSMYGLAKKEMLCAG